MICPDCGSSRIVYTYPDYAQCEECDAHLPVEEFDVRYRKQQAKRNGRVVDDIEEENEESRP